MIDLMIVEKKRECHSTCGLNVVNGCCVIEKVLPSAFAGCDKTVDAGKGIF